MKKAIVSLGVAAVTLAMASTAFASSSTGSNSPVTTNTSLVTSTSVSNSNSADVTNEVSTIAGSGQNGITSTTGDINGASITSGDAHASSGVSNQLNLIKSKLIAPATTSNATSVMPSDSSTGSGSAVNSTISQADAASVSNENTSSIANGVSTAGFTGQNVTGTTTGDVNTATVMSGLASSRTWVGVKSNVVYSKIIR